MSILEKVRVGEVDMVMAMMYPKPSDPLSKLEERLRKALMHGTKLLLDELEERKVLIDGDLAMVSGLRRGVQHRASSLDWGFVKVVWAYENSFVGIKRAYDKATREADVILRKLQSPDVDGDSLRRIQNDIIKLGDNREDFNGSRRFMMSRFIGKIQSNPRFASLLRK